MSTINNSVRLIGHLGANPEIKTFGENKKVAKLSLATNDSYRDAEGNKVTQTDWHNVVAWGPSASFAEKYLTKGSHIAIDGKLTNRSYEDKEGTKRYVTEVVVNEFQLLDKAPQES